MFWTKLPTGISCACTYVCMYGITNGTTAEKQIARIIVGRDTIPMYSLCRRSMQYGTQAPVAPIPYLFLDCSIPQHQQFHTAPDVSKGGRGFDSGTACREIEILTKNVVPRSRLLPPSPHRRLQYYYVIPATAEGTSHCVVTCACIDPAFIVVSFTRILRRSMAENSGFTSPYSFDLSFDLFLRCVDPPYRAQPAPIQNIISINSLILWSQFARRKSSRAVHGKEETTFHPKEVKGSLYSSI